MAENDNVTRFRHDPIQMLRDVATQIETNGKRIDAGIVILINEDNHLIWRDAGFHKKDVLWALETARLKLMLEE